MVPTAPPQDYDGKFIPVRNALQFQINIGYRDLSAPEITQTDRAGY
jgi:hypothetical protein